MIPFCFILIHVPLWVKREYICYMNSWIYILFSVLSDIFGALSEMSLLLQNARMPFLRARERQVHSLPCLTVIAINWAAAKVEINK